MCTSYDIVGVEMYSPITLEECAQFCQEKAIEKSVGNPCCEFGWQYGVESKGNYCTVHRGGFEYRSGNNWDW